MLSHVQNFLLHPQQTALQATNIHPTKKDAFGFSAIQRAIFDERLADVSQLLGENQLPIDAKFVSQESKALSSLLVSDQFDELKRAILELPLDQIKEGIKNPKFAQFVQFLDQFSVHSFHSYNQHLIHLLALFAPPHLVIQTLKLHPEWIELVDDQGNSVAHYGALNPDENVMINLVEKGASLFQENSEGQTALGLLVHRIQKQDPLNWDKRDLFLFLNHWFPTTLQLAVKSGMLPLSLEAMASTIANVVVRSSLSYFISFYPYLSILFSNCQTPFQKFLLAVALLGTSWIPIVNLPIQAYMTYRFAYRAYQTLGQAWQHLKFRPIKAVCISIIKTANAIDQVSSFYNHLSELKTIIQPTLHPSSGFEKKSFVLQIDQEPIRDEPSALSEEFIQKTPPPISKKIINSTERTLKFFMKVQQIVSEEIGAMYGHAIRAAREMEWVKDNLKQMMIDPNLPKSHELIPAGLQDCSTYSVPGYLNLFVLEDRIKQVSHPECEQGAEVILQGQDLNVVLEQLNPNEIGYRDRVDRVKKAANALFQARNKKLQADLSVCETYQLPSFFGWWNNWVEQLEHAVYPQCIKVANYFRTLDCKQGLAILDPQNHPGQAEKYLWLIRKFNIICDLLGQKNRSSLND